jgi:hypothetical protein
MDKGALLSLIELTSVFALVIGFGLWQLRSLDKLDREDEKRAKQEPVSKD